MTSRTTRRTFIAHTTAAASIAMLPRLARAHPANSKPNLAIVGTGGRGWVDIHEASAGGAANVAAVCDVDRNFLNRAKGAFPQATAYTDFRKMLEQKDIDGVMVATPDHMHAAISIAAMRAGKHVCCQKPLTHNVHEARAMRKVAKETKRITQMGIQHHSGIPNRLCIHAVQSGAVGKIKEVHVWTDRPGRFWPQPVAVPDHTDPVPANLDWDLWLGVARHRPYVNGLYHTFRWRSFLDFGTGAVGDMAVHLIDPVYTALQLTAPRTILSHGAAPTKHTFPAWSTYDFTFPGTQYAVDNCKIIWYDGGRKPDATLALGGDLSANGAIYIGERGTILHNYASAPRAVGPDTPKLKLPKLDESGNHYMLFTQAIKGEAETNCPFEYSAPLTEAILLGTVAARFPNVQLKWDAAAERITNKPEANRYLTREYRKGWAFLD